MRADSAAVAQGLAQSRARATELIHAGSLLCNGVVVKKPAQDIPVEAVLTCTAAPQRYVGRGGYKLERALMVFPIVLNGAVCLDIGASTGGFTDCMLQNGAKQVFALDVGHGQLAQALCTDSRVVNLEGTDIRVLPTETIGGAVDFIGIDVSFISLRLVLPAAFSLLRDDGSAVVLVKPQFEAGRAALDKHGVVKSAKAHLRVLSELSAAMAASGFRICGAAPSGIRGGSGNVEYVFYLRKDAGAAAIPDFAALAAEALAQV